jgi:hypothetical protein
MVGDSLIMTPRREALLKRLDEIAASLASTGHGLALIGVGSVGAEIDRIDDYSDLDFFAVVRDGYKQRFIENLDWLSAVHPIAYVFQNTVDGFKLLYADGIFCEMAVFDPAEMAHIPFAGPRIVWSAEDFDPSLAVPRNKPPAKRDTEWLLGEALTNLYVGLGRYHRGEKLSAIRFVQGYAVDRVVELVEHLAAPTPAYRDQFMAERRFEARFPAFTAPLLAMMQGYDRTPESALAILNFLDQHFEINPAIRDAIRDLCRPR